MWCSMWWCQLQLRFVDNAKFTPDLDHTPVGSHSSDWSSSMSPKILQIDTCHLWPLISWTCKGSFIISMHQVWFQLDSKLFKWGEFYILSLSYNLTSDDLWWTYKGSHIVSINQYGSNQTSIFQLDFRWPLTMICDLWPHQQMRVSMLHIWLKSIKACGS